MQYFVVKRGSLRMMKQQHSFVRAKFDVGEMCLLKNYEFQSRKLQL